jgi:hypothetical protein
MMFAGLAAVWLTGFGVVRRMFPRPLRWSLHNVLLFSLGIGAGAGVLSCLWFVSLVLLGPGYGVMAGVTAGAAIAALAFGLFTRRQGTELRWADGPEPPWYLRTVFLVAIALAAFTFLSAVSSNPHGDEGAWSIWNLRARFLFRAGPAWHDAFSNDIGWSHPDYPLLLPGLITLCWTLAGGESTDVPIAIAFLFALGTVALLSGLIGVLRGKTHALLGGTLLLGSAGFLSLSAAQYGDVPLSYFILATLGLLCLQDRHPEDLRFSALAGLMAGFAAWTRNEGMVFVGAVIVARVVVAIRYRDRTAAKPFLPRLACLLAGLLLPLAVVIFFKLRVAGAGDLASQTSASILQHLANPARWIATLQVLVIALFSLGRFVVSIVLVLALYWYLVRFQVEDRDRPAVAFLGLTLILALGSELLVYIALVDHLALELATGLERTLLHLWPAGLLLFFLASGPLQLTAVERKTKSAKKTPKPARRPLETR